MAQVGDVLQVQHIYTVAGVECRNVFYYVSDSQNQPVISENQIATGLADYWSTRFPDIVSAQTVSVEVVVENLTDGINFGSAVTGYTGNRLGDAMPSFVALGVKLPRVTKLTRNGYKRIAGISEDDCSDNEITFSGTMIPAIQQYCAGSIDLQQINGANDDIFLDGVIVGRTLNAQGNYELDLNKINQYSTAQPQSLLRTQATRKEQT